MQDSLITQAEDCQIQAAGIIQWFVAFMATYPSMAAAAAADAELDHVVGRECLPTIADEKGRPYSTSNHPPVLRIQAPFLAPTPHYSTADFWFIPRDTAVVLLNCWTIHLDGERYLDAFTFNPSRYMDDDLSSSASSKQADPMKRDHWTFGAGRRICPGFVLAERELWLAISGLLWAYTFHQIPEEPISLEEYEGVSGRTHLPFRMRLIPRHESAGQLLEMNSGSRRGDASPHERELQVPFHDGSSSPCITTYLMNRLPLQCYLAYAIEFLLIQNSL
ncbi:cytochrome P450 [Mycena leptocephala]|nr:cytochrome P450 [Mycena leptocephala]